MALPIAMRIVRLEGQRACCETKGVEHDISLVLLSDQAVFVGDYVLVHMGYALQTITAAYAQTTWELFSEVAPALDPANA